MDVPEIGLQRNAPQIWLRPQNMYYFIGLVVKGYHIFFKLIICQLEGPGLTAYIVLVDE